MRTSCRRSSGPATLSGGHKADVSPYAGLDYLWLKTDAFGERGESGGEATVLKGRSSTEHAGFFTLGTKVRRELGMKNSAAWADISWRHTFGNIHPESTLSLPGSGRYVIRGTELDRNAALVGVGVEYAPARDMTLKLGYHGTFGEAATDHGAQLQWQMRF